MLFSKMKKIKKTLKKKLLDGFKFFQIDRKITQYFFVGFFAFITDFIIFFLLYKNNYCDWFSASTISFLFSTFVNYFVSSKFVFLSGIRYSKFSEIILVFLVSSIGLVMNQFWLFIFIEKFSLNIIFSKITASGFVFLWNFYGRRKFIFV